MVRKIFLFLLLGGFVGLSVFFFYKFNEKKPIQHDFYAAIPTQSIWLMEVRNAGNLFSTLKGTNIIYDELVQNEVWSDWTNKFERLDSIVNSNPLKYESFKDIRLLLALVPSGASTNDLLISIQIPRESNEKSLQEKLITPLFGAIIEKQKQYDGALIKEYVGASDFSVFSCYHKGYAILSRSEMVVEDAIRQLNSGVSLATDIGFGKVMQTAGKSRKINWYVHQKAFAKWLSSKIDKQHNFTFRSGIGLSEWTELDLWLKPNSIMFNGYCFSGNTKNDFMDVFKGQVPTSVSVTDILPISTAFFMSYSISSFSEFLNSYEGYLKSNNKFSDFDEERVVLNDSANINARELLIRNVGSEVCLAVLEIQNDINTESISSIYDKTLTIMRLKNPDVWIDESIDLVKANETDDLYKAVYREIPIYEMDVDGLISKNLGGVFEGMENRYFVVIEEYLVFGEKISTLRELINSWKGDKVLSEDDHFESFSENMASTSHITIFNSLARSPYLFSYFLNKTGQSWIGEKVDFFRKFEGAVLQISRENDEMDYYSVFIKHNPIYKKVTSSLWELPLDTQIISAPQLFENHYTKAGEILVQDVNNKLYLISNTGRILWSRVLDGATMSSFYKVDKYKNDKFQLLFNTKNSVYLIDRNGEDVSGFPIKLNVSASGPLSIMDYDRNRKYRLLQPLDDGNIKCFDIKGDVVKGWKHKSESKVKNPIKYIQHRGKDYLITLFENGSVKALNRKGQARIDFKESFKLAKNSTFRFQKGDKLSSTYIVGTDSSGNIMRLSFTDKMELLQVGSFTSDHYFTLYDLDGDENPEYLFQDQGKFFSYSLTGEQKLKIEEDFEFNSKPGLYQSEIKNYIAISARSKDNVWLYNFYGEKMDGSPFLGSSKPIISDINLDGRLELITTSSNGMVYCYVLK